MITFRFADYHVLAEDNSVAVTRAISEYCWDDSEERKRGTVLRSLTAITSNFRFITVWCKYAKKIKTGSIEPTTLGAGGGIFRIKRYVFG